MSATSWVINHHRSIGNNAMHLTFRFSFPGSLRLICAFICAVHACNAGFKYASIDSVLVVNHDDYKQCSTDAPLSRFTDGDTRFTFDRFGLFYFVSGAPGHCEAGQRMIARVMAPSSLIGAPVMMPPASNVGAPTPSSPVVAVPSSGSSSGAVTSSTLSPSPTEQASGASTTVVSSVALGLVVVAFVSLFVLVSECR
jgi:hypothetical protein